MAELQPGDIVYYHRADTAFPMFENAVGVIVKDMGMQSIVHMYEVAWFTTSLNGFGPFDSTLLVKVGELSAPEVPHG